MQEEDVTALNSSSKLGAGEVTGGEMRRSRWGDGEMR